MIKIIYPGLYGTGSDFLQMHQMRARVFGQRMGWDVTIHNNLEFDQFDTSESIYVLVYEENQ